MYYKADWTGVSIVNIYNSVSVVSGVPYKVKYRTSKGKLSIYIRQRAYSVVYIKGDP